MQCDEQVKNKQHFLVLIDMTDDVLSYVFVSLTNVRAHSVLQQIFHIVDNGNIWEQMKAFQFVAEPLGC